MMSDLAEFVVVLWQEHGVLGIAIGGSIFVMILGLSYIGFFLNLLRERNRLTIVFTIICIVGATIAGYYFGGYGGIIIGPFVGFVLAASLFVPVVVMVESALKWLIFNFEPNWRAYMRKLAIVVLSVVVVSGLVAVSIVLWGVR